MSDRKRATARGFDWLEQRTLLSAAPGEFAPLAPADRAETLIVSFQPQTPLLQARGLLTSVDAIVVRANPAARVALVALTPDGDAADILAQLRAAPIVRAANPNQTIQVDVSEISRMRALEERLAARQERVAALRNRMLAARQDRFEARLASSGVDPSSIEQLGVRFAYGVTPEQAREVIAATGGLISYISPDQRYYQLTFGPDRDLDALGDRLEADPSVLYVQPPAIARLGPAISDTGVLPTSEVQLTLGAKDEADPQQVIALIDSLGGTIGFISPTHKDYQLAFGPDRDLDAIAATLRQADSLVEYVVPKGVAEISSSLALQRNTTSIASGVGTPSTQVKLGVRFKYDVTSKKAMETLTGMGATIIDTGIGQTYYEITSMPGLALDALSDRLEADPSVLYVQPPAIARLGPAISDTGVLPTSEVQLTLGAKDEADPQQVIALIDSLGGTIGFISPTHKDYQLAFGPDRDLDAIAATLRQADSLVEYVVPKGVASADLAPGDPLFRNQYGLHQDNNFDIDAPQTWNVTTDHVPMKVAVVDTGIDVSNPDLANKTDIASAQNFVAMNNDVTDTTGHGTFVSGIIAAQTNNGIGIAGTDWNAQIVPLKAEIAGLPTGRIDLDAAVAAITTATNHGVRIINLSFGGPNFYLPLRNAINYAGSQNVAVAVAAGNDSRNIDAAPFYPASYHLANQINVAAITRTGALATFSNFGPSTVDVGAPGVSILSTSLLNYPGQTAETGTRFAYGSGTSFAAPFVAGIASLMISRNQNLTANQVVARIKSAAKPVSSLAGKTVTGGMVDALNAIGDIPVPADYDGDGKKDYAVARYQSDGALHWLVLRSSTNTFQDTAFGGFQDFPAPADYDGDGKTDLAVYGTGNRFAIVYSGGGSRTQTYGFGVDYAVPADYDGDGRADLAVYGPYGTNGVNRYGIEYSGGGMRFQDFGGSADRAKPADLNGDGRTDLIVYGPYGANGSSRYAALLSNGTPFSQNFGGLLDRPVPADYDGDGRADIAVYGQSNGQNRYAILYSGGGSNAPNFGGSSDDGVPADFDGDQRADISVFGYDRYAVLLSRGGSRQVSFVNVGNR